MARKLPITRRYSPRIVDPYGRPVQASFGESYRGASYTRSMQGWRPPSGDPAYHITHDIELLRRRSHDLVRNTPMALAAVSTSVTNTIGPGLRCYPKIDADALNMTEEQAAEWENNVRREFELFCTPCLDITRTMDFLRMQELVFRTTLVSGDCFALFPRVERPGDIPYKTRIQLIEGERVINRDYGGDIQGYNNGIKRDEYGAPLSYTIASGEIESLSGGAVTFTDVPAYGALSGRKNVLHIMFPTRPNQPRGVPMLSPVIEMLKQVTRLTESELMASVVASMYTVFVKSLDEMGPQGAMGTDLAPDRKEENAPNYALESGAVVVMDPGEEIQTADPSRPNDSFDPFFMAMMRMIGSALEIPSDLLLKHFPSSYSASRAAMLMAWKHFEQRRQLIAFYFCQPVYDMFLEEAVLLGRVDAPGYLSDPMIRHAYSQCDWVGSPFGTVDPVKDANAQKLLVELGVKTRSRVTRETTGENWEDTIRQIKHEQAAMGVTTGENSGMIGGGEDEREEPDDDTEDETNPLFRPN